MDDKPTIKDDEFITVCDSDLDGVIGGGTVNDVLALVGRAA